MSLYVLPSHPLDRPVWSALNAHWATRATGDLRAMRIDPAYGPFGASADRLPENLAALAALDFGDTGLYVFEVDDFPLPKGVVVRSRAIGHQMVCTRLSDAPPTSVEATELGDADAAEMLALATLTKPGPFSIRTHQLGDFVGIRADGRLAAMAGMRMRLPGYTEVSGVCPHPDFRGRGYAGALMRIVTARILARGDMAFLHTYADNAVAIALYRSLGFAYRQTLTLSILDKP